MFHIPCIYLVNAGAILGNPKGNSRTKVVLASVTQSQVLEVKRKCHLKGTDTVTMAEESDDT